MLGQVLGLDQDFVKARGDVDLSGLGTGSGDPGQLGQAAFELGQIGLGIVAGLVQYARDQPLVLGEQGIEQVFGVDLLLTQAHGRGRGLADGLL